MKTSPTCRSMMSLVIGVLAVLPIVASGVDATAQVSTVMAAAQTEGVESAAGGEDPVDVALDYVHARISKVQHNNAQLKEELVKAERTESETHARFERATARLEEVPRLRNQVNSLLAEKSSALAQLTQEWEREKALTSQLRNISGVSTRRAQALLFARGRLAKEMRAQKTLKRKLQNVTASNGALSKTLVEERHENAVLADTMHGKDAELVRSRSFIEHMRGSLHTLQVAEKQDAARLDAASLAKEQALTAEHEAEFNVKIGEQDKLALRKQLSSLQAQERQEAEIGHELKAEQARELKLAEEQREAQKRRKQEMDVEHDLRQQALDLQKKLQDVDKMRQQAQGQAQETKDELASAQAEVQEVKGTVPWLQAKVAQEKNAADNATSQANEAYRDRDEAREELAAARQKIVSMEQQYASIVSMVGKTVAKGQALEDATDGSAGEGVVGNLTALVHDAVAAPTAAEPDPALAEPSPADDPSAEALLSAASQLSPPQSQTALRGGSAYTSSGSAPSDAADGPADLLSDIVADPDAA